MISEKYGMENTGNLSKKLQDFVQGTLSSNHLSNLFPFNKGEGHVPVGLDGGVCGTALPLLSLESGDYRWLKLSE